MDQQFKIIASTIDQFLNLQYYQKLQKLIEFSQIQSGTFYYKIDTNQISWKNESESKNQFEIVFNNWELFNNVNLNHLRQLGLLFQTIKTFNDDLIDVNHQNKPDIKLLNVDIDFDLDKCIDDHNLYNIAYLKTNSGQILKTTWKCAILKENGQYEIVDNYPLLAHNPQLSKFINNWTYHQRSN